MNEYLKMIESSWTWEKLTPQEREIFTNRFKWACNKYKIKNQEIMHELYFMFLLGCGYKTGEFRDDKDV